MAKYVIGTIATFSLVMLLAITIMLFANALPFFSDYSLSDFLFGTHWRPAAEPSELGILPLVWGSLLVTLIAMLVSIPAGIGAALYLNGVAPMKIREVVKPVIELLGSVPSVVYGLFGLTILAPFAQKLLSLPVGQCAAVAGFTLGIMVIPVIVSVAEDALAAVPRALWEAALSLGSTKWEALTKVILPAAKSGVWAAVLLSFGRAIGETMTVLMVAGGAAQITLSPFKPIRPMTVAIAAEMGETPAGSQHFHALFAVGVVLFLVTLTINIIAQKYAAQPGEK